MNSRGQWDHARRAFLRKKRAVCWRSAGFCSTRRKMEMQKEETGDLFRIGNCNEFLFHDAEGSFSADGGA